MVRFYQVYLHLLMNENSVTQWPRLRYIPNSLYFTIIARGTIFYATTSELFLHRNFLWKFKVNIVSPLAAISTIKSTGMQFRNRNYILTLVAAGMDVFP